MSPHERGFSLTEVLISLGIMLAVLAGTFQVMGSAMKDTQTVKQVTNLNANLRSTMDVIVRDVLQVGQGLPGRRRISIPNGPGATPINRPGPAASGPCAGATRFPAGAWIAAVTSGPGLGPRVPPPPTSTRLLSAEECTDVITMLAADATFEDVVVTLAADGTEATVDPAVDITDGPDGRANDLRLGDLLMIERENATALMHITDVDDQTVTFGTGTGPGPTSNSLNLNQFDATLAMLGTINQLVALSGPITATRIRMITYYVDVLPADPENPRVMRRINNGPENAIGVDVEKLQFRYDITDSVTNPTNVDLDPADFAAGGACGANPCSPNQIRIVNITLAMRSQRKMETMNDYHKNTLFTQVSARSLSFFDQYR